MSYTKSKAPETTGPIGKPGQSIRGGYLIARRQKESGILIRVASRPFEHGSLAEAKAEAQVLADRHDDEFTVFAQVASVLPPLRDIVAAPSAEPPLLIPGSSPTPVVVVERRAPRRRKNGGAA